MSDRIWRWVACHLPRRLVYWATIRLGVAALPAFVPPGDLLLMDALERWDAAHARKP